MERVRGSPGPDQGSLVMFSVMFQGSSLILSIVVISWSFMLTIIQTPNTREQQNKLFHLGCLKKMNSSKRINIGLFYDTEQEPSSRVSRVFLLSKNFEKFEGVTPSGFSQPYNLQISNVNWDPNLKVKDTAQSYIKVDF